MGLGNVDTTHQPPSTNMIERWLSMRINSKDPAAGNFDLYYFARMPKSGKASKTVLFCAGGPGQIVEGPMSGVTFADFLTDNGYNVVYFHQRGAGLSQLPGSNKYDRFLKTEYAARDIEAIRRDFLGESGIWDAIIGWSYGTVVAQQYTHLHPGNVERLILIGPMSRDKFIHSADAFGDVLREIRSTDRHTLTKIYRLLAFNDLSDWQKEFIVDGVFGNVKNEGIFDRTEEAFGSVDFVIDSYCDLKNKGELENYRLDDYSREFFQALRNLRMFGWRPKAEFSTDNQVGIGHRIKEEILYSHRAIDDCSVATRLDSPELSNRTQYVVRTYDGINMPFLREWLKAGKEHILDALKKSGGQANELRNVNKYIGKIGIRDDESIAPWEAAHYKHDRPTLILKGSADTVGAGGAAEFFFRDGLTGDRFFIEFRGIGHTLESETITFDENDLSGTVRTEPFSLAPGKARQLLGTYRGRQLSDSFRFQVEANDVQTEIKLVGLGIVGKNQSGLLDVVALLENVGSQPVAVPRKWTLNNKLFQATMSLDPQTINPGTDKVVSGKIEAAWINSAFRIETPQNIEPGLEYLCAQVRSEKNEIGVDRFIEIWIRNNSNNTATSTARGWTVSAGNSSSTFNIEPDVLGPEEVFNKQISIESPVLAGLNLREGPVIRLQPHGQLLSCLQYDGEDKLSVVIYNPEETEDPGVPQIDGKQSQFSQTFDINLPPIKNFQAVVIQLTDPKYTWEAPLSLRGRQL